MSASEPIRDDSILRIPEHVLTRSVSDETVLLNLDNEHYYGLDDVGARFFALLEQGVTFGEAVTVLLGEYDVERDVLEADLGSLVADLRRNGLVEFDAA
jgi:hypothetical protein